MPVDLPTADAMDALALQIFDLHIIPPAPGSALGYTTSGPPTGIHGPDITIDQQVYSLLAPVMAAIDNRVLERAPYTLNMTMALKTRKKKWYMSLEELDSRQPFPCSAMFEDHEQPGFVSGGNNSGGFTLAAAIVAAQLKIWANLIRQAVAPT